MILRKLATHLSFLTLLLQVGSCQVLDQSVDDREVQREESQIVNLDSAFAKVHSDNLVREGWLVDSLPTGAWTYTKLNGDSLSYIINWDMYRDSIIRFSFPAIFSQNDSLDFFRRAAKRSALGPDELTFYFFSKQGDLKDLTSLSYIQVLVNDITSSKAYEVDRISILKIGYSNHDLFETFYRYEQDSVLMYFQSYVFESSELVIALGLNYPGDVDEMTFSTNWTMLIEMVHSLFFQEKRVFPMKEEPKSYKKIDFRTLLN